MSMIKQRLRSFNLSWISKSYEERIKYATDKSLSYEEFLEHVLEYEVNNRKNNRIATRKDIPRQSFPTARR